MQMDPLTWKRAKTVIGLCVLVLACVGGGILLGWW